MNMLKLLFGILAMIPFICHASNTLAMKGKPIDIPIADFLFNDMNALSANTLVNWTIETPLAVPARTEKHYVDPVQSSADIGNSKAFRGLWKEKAAHLFSETHGWSLLAVVALCCLYKIRSRRRSQPAIYQREFMRLPPLSKSINIENMRSPNIVSLENYDTAPNVRTVSLKMAAASQKVSEKNTAKFIH